MRYLLITFCCLAAIASPAHSEEAAIVVFFSGSPVLMLADGSKKMLSKSELINSGTRISTKNGFVQLRFLDGASMSLQPGTEFAIDRYRFTGKGVQTAADDGVVMSLIKGALRTVTGFLGKANKSQYKITTSVATIGIRGTEFGASVDDSGLTVKTYAGLVEVCSQGGCADVGPAETVKVRSLVSSPEKSRQSMGQNLSTLPFLPENPVGQERGVLSDQMSTQPSYELINSGTQPIPVTPTGTYPTGAITSPIK